MKIIPNLEKEGNIVKSEGMFVSETDEEGVNSPPNSPDSENSPVKFTLGPTELKSSEKLQSKSPATTPSHVKIQPPLPPPSEETEVERSLPWKRQVSNEPLPSAVSLYMPDDDRPLSSPYPSWASNPSYHHLKDSGSPYVSPETTIIATPPPTNHSSVFDVFQSSISDNQEKADDTLPPPPWKQNNDENEPITAHVSNAMSDKANNDLQSCHHDNKCIPSTHSVIIPSEYGDELPKSSGLPGSASDSVLPKHWQPIEMQTLPKKRSMVDAEALMDEIAFQHEVSSRVQKWLENSNSDVDPGDQKMEDVEPCDNDNNHDEQYDSDIETSHL